MRRANHFGGRAKAAVRMVLGFRSGPVPRPAMLRSGGAIGIGFVAFLAMGRIEDAVVCAVFTNFLVLVDKADDRATRIWVQVLGAVLFTICGAIGTLVTGNDPLILVTTFAIALFAGFIHGTTPGVEALPRFSLCCLVVCAFLPVGQPEVLGPVAFGAMLAVGAVLLDDYLQNGRRGRHIRRIRAAMSYPGPRFSIVFGAAAVCGLAIGLIWNQTRPYWVTITTLLVMQPDRRANTVRVTQRFLGTILGVIVAFLVVQALPAVVRADGLLVVIVVLPFLWPLGYDRNYAVGVAILSTWVLILIDTALQPGELITPLFFARLSDTAIGCAVALAGSFVVYDLDAKTGGG